MLAALSLMAAFAGGYLARRFGLPGGAIVGALLATAAVSLGIGEVAVAEPVRLVLFVGVGTMIGTLVTRRTLGELPAVAGQAVGAATLIIVAGILVTLLLRAFGMSPTGDVLATSPGALSVLSAAALENDLGAPTVALFHIVRILLILLTLPVLVRLLPRTTREASPVMGAPPDPVSVEDLPPSGRSPPTRAQLSQLLTTVVAAAAGGTLALRIGIGGALIVGTTFGAATVTLWSRRPVYRPAWIGLSVQCGLGWLIGTLVTTQTVIALREAFWAAVLSSVLLIAAGIGIALGMRRLGLAPAGDVLATSPGALEALAAIADEHHAGAVQVALFHTVRLLLVILSLPLLLAMVR